MKNNIREIIDENGLKTSFVIKKSGISKSTFYEIMNGNVVPSLLNARKISGILNKPLEVVFPNDDFE